MQYPGIVTVGTAENEWSLKHSLVHEIVHQWFYAIVNNDPYHDGWLDEGLTELTTSLYLNDFSFAQKFYTTYSKPTNLPLSEYEGADIIKRLYAQPVMKFKDLFDSLGGGEVGITFLHAYFTNYQYKQVSTDEFVRFTKAYFGLNDDTFFQDWLKKGKQDTTQ
ncbi:M1 family aminopeptidase [Paenibacillus sp. GP183]|uniref:M1 family aminopeptidase n=1 Tax=Paenibacillus sp. GP183 TaxID=1882751 RepID=UPI000B82B6E8|nr:M1 family aminopeptidase [Paenibacillus sp. GP183]